jgi:hypothetical protein
MPLGCLSKELTTVDEVFRAGLKALPETGEALPVG